MKTLKILTAAILFITLVSSCSDDNFGIEYEVISTDDLVGNPGDTLDFSMRFSHSSGIQQIILESSELGLDYLENLADRLPSVVRDFTIIIPEDAATGEVFNIELRLSEANGNRIVEDIEVETE